MRTTIERNHELREPIPTEAVKLLRANTHMGEAESPSRPRFSTVRIPCSCAIALGALLWSFGHGAMPWIGTLLGLSGATIMPIGLLLILHLRVQKRISSLVEVVRDLEERVSSHE